MSDLIRRGDIIDATTERADIADEQVERLQRENRQLRRELDDARRETARARSDADRALSELRRQLSPLYKALQQVFGELDAAGVDNNGAPASGDPRKAAIWESWKMRLGPQCAKIIDALLLQPGMNTTQLAIAIGTNRNNIPSLIFKLNKAGLIDKESGRFSLKAL